MSIILVKTNAAQIARDLDIGARELRLVLEQALAEAGREIRKDYGRATSTWQHKPHVMVEVNTRGGDAELLAGTDDRIFAYVDQGTRPHLIFPKRAKALRFFSGFRPKTMPNHLSSGAGGVFGNVLFRPYVKHPGTKPRRFTQKIQERSNKRTPNIVLKYIKQWGKRRRAR